MVHFESRLKIQNETETAAETWGLSSPCQQLLAIWILLGGISDRFTFPEGATFAVVI